MSSVHSNPFDINPPLHTVPKGTQPSIIANAPTLLSSLKDSLRDKINQLGVQLASVKTTIQEFSSKNADSTHQYKDLSKLNIHLEEKINVFCDQIDDLSRSTILHSNQIDSLVAHETQVDYGEEIEILKKINEDLQGLSTLQAPSMEIQQALLDVNAQFKTAYLITLRSQLILHNHPSHASKVSFNERLQGCFDLKNAIDHVIKQTQEQMTHIDQAQSSPKSFLLYSAFHENLTLAQELSTNLSPLLDTIKSTAQNTPHHAISTSAAEKGKAARGNETILDYIATRQPLKGKANSAQDVYLVNETTVFKNKVGAENQIAEAEEQIMRGLASFKCKSGVVEGYQVNQPGVKLKYDFNQLNKEKRYFEPFTLTTKRVKYFLANKSDLNSPRIVNEEDKDSLRGLNIIRQWKNTPLIAVKNDDTRVVMSFSELAKYLNNKGEESMDINEVYAENSDVDLSKDDAFSEALYTFIRLDRLPMVIAPKFNNEAEEQAYLNCEKCGWYNASLLEQTVNQIKQTNLALDVIESDEKIRESAIKILEIPFSTLMERQIDGKSITDYRTITPLDGSHLKLALNCEWELADLSLRKEVKSINQATNQIETTYEEVKWTQVKPFLTEMFLCTELEKRPTAYAQILRKIAPEAQYNAVFLSGECQLLDLHSSNLGLSPVPNPSYNKWKDQKFSYAVSLTQAGSTKPSSTLKENISFKEFMLDYLDKKILGTTPISFSKDNNTKDSVFFNDASNSEMKEIRQALDSSWGFDFFDLDRCLSESNEIINIYNKSYIAPFVSTLLFTSWKDIPLAPTVIERLKQDKYTTNLQIKEWLQKNDSPLLTTLNHYQEWRDYAPMLNKMLSNYSVSSMIRLRSDNNNISVEQVRNSFAADLANLINSNDSRIVTPIKNDTPFWKGVETMLSSDLESNLSQVTTLKEMTWKELAEEHHTDEEVLKNLNPDLRTDLDVPKGVIIKRPFEKKTLDLTSDSPDALENRLKIAKQLFPRITYAQITALTARQDAEQSYLENFEKLKNSAPEDLKEEIISFIKQPTSPISSLERGKLLHQVTVSEDLSTFKNNLLEKYQPTYFNLMKAMYPLAADLEQTGIIAYGEKNKMAVFNPALTINQALADAESRCNLSQKHFLTKLMDRLETIINQGTYGEYHYD